MNPAPNTSSTNDSDKTTTVVSSIAGSAVGKERELIGQGTTEVVSEISQEVELPKEVEKAGVEALKDTIELPPDIKKLGVTPAGPTTPVAITVPLPKVVLPISDQQIVAGLHVQIINSLRWLALWCVRKLKIAHIKLKEIHGKIVRVKE